MGFTRGAVEELSGLHGEPDWLRARRLESFALYERLGMPDTRRDEEWRKADLRGLNLESFTPVFQPDGAMPPLGIDGIAGVLRQRGVSPGRADLDPQLAAQGVVLCPLPRAARDYAELVDRFLFRAVKPDRDKFAALHGALFSGGTFVYVPDGVTLDRPLLSQFSSVADGGAALPHTLVVAGKGARFELIDELLSDGSDGAILASGSAEVFLDEGADVGYIGLQRWSTRTWQFANHRVHLGRDARIRVLEVALGGHFAKLRLEAILEGPGAQAELKGIFFGSGEQFFDFHTLQDHLASHTLSDLLFKGALRDAARSVYVGLVRVGKNARRAEAYQANRNLLLSDKAKATSEPILEIENNDISRCTHGATVGPVDPEHMFYLQSRGIPRSVAQRMVVKGFLGEILDRIPAAHAREVVEGELSARIG